MAKQISMNRISTMLEKVEILETFAEGELEKETDDHTRANIEGKLAAYRRVIELLNTDFFSGEKGA